MPVVAAAPASPAVSAADVADETVTESSDGEVDVEAALAAIRELASGGVYTAGSDVSGPSGAYGYGSATWRGYGGYDEAYLAPPAVQDARARADIQRLLGDGDGDGEVASLPYLWFGEHAEELVWLEEFPLEASLVVGVYAQRWQHAYETEVADTTETETGPAVAAPGIAGASGPVVIDGPSIGGGTSPSVVEASRSDLRAAPPQLSPHGDGAMRSIVFPVLGPVTYHDGWNECRDNCLRRHEGTDIAGVRMQPLLAAVDGTITSIGYRSDNAGLGVTIYGDDGWHYNYFHTNNDNPGSDDSAADVVWQWPPGLRVGDRVEAGQIIGYMGDSGNSEGSIPHLHFEIRDPAGLPHNPYWSLQAAERRYACTIAIGPWSDVHTPGDTANGVAHTTVTPLFGDGAWLIDSQGRVTATGDAALITPSRGLGCKPGPTIPHGTDNAGWE